MTARSKLSVFDLMRAALVELVAEHDYRSERFNVEHGPGFIPDTAGITAARDALGILERDEERRYGS